MKYCWLKLIAAVVLAQGVELGCVSKGDTRVGSMDQEEGTESSSLCAQYCRRTDEAGCSTHSNCEANCTANATRCPDETDNSLKCVTDEDNTIECDSVGSASSPECLEELEALAICLAIGGSDVVADTAECAERGDGCGSCCEGRFSEGAAQWSSTVDTCISGDCSSPCAGLAGDSNAVPTAACSSCVIDCVYEACDLGETECGTYLNCTTSCPAVSTPTEPLPAATTDFDPCVGDPENGIRPVVGGDCAPLPPEPGAEPEPASVELPSSPNLGVALRRWAEVQCALEMRCNFLLINIVAGDEAYCVAQQEASNEWAASLPGNAYSTTNVDACAQRLADMSCDEWHQPNTDCRVMGELADGEPCTDNSQCESAWCQSARFSCGVCAPRPSEGDACTHWSECPGGDCRDSECVPLGLEGQACDAESPCYGSFVTCVGGVCRKNDRALGESCGPTAEQPYCDQVTANLFCSSTGVCVEGTVAMAGEACPNPGRCGGSGSCVDSVCVAGPEVGDACSDESGPYCRWPLVCKDGACIGLPGSYECAAEAPSTAPSSSEPVPSVSGSGGAAPSSSEPAPSLGAGGAPPPASGGAGGPSSSGGAGGAPPPSSGGAGGPSSSGGAPPSPPGG